MPTTISHRDRIKTWGLRGLVALGVLVAVVSLLLGGVFTVLRTDWGGERLRRVIVSRANRTIRGELGIARLKIGDRIVLTDVTLRDPDGQLAAQVARVEVGFRILPLLHEELRLTDILIESPRIVALWAENGLNITRATEPRTKTPQPPAPKTSLADKEGFVIRIDRFRLDAGDVTLASATTETRKETARFADLHLEVTARFATGNGALDARLGLAGQSLRAPFGPLTLESEVHRHRDLSQFDVDGALLGGMVSAHAKVTGAGLDGMQGRVAVSIPRTALGGFAWGPIRIDAAAAPGHAPTLDLLVAAPGIELAAKTVDGAGFDLGGRLALSDLAQTGKALQALANGAVPTLAGHGDLSLSVQGPMDGAPRAWGATCKGLFDGLRVGDTTIAGVTIEAKTTQLAMSPDQADVRVAIGAITAGTTRLTKLALGLGARRENLTATATLAGPEAVALAVDGHVEDQGRQLALTRIALRYPRVEWTSSGTARLRSDGDTSSLQGLRLSADEQHLALDASKTPKRIDVNLGATLRLDRLPSMAVAPALGLAGTLGLQVNATGAPEDPRVVAQVRLGDGKVRTLSGIRAAVDATLANQRVDGTLRVEAPFANLDGAFGVPVDLLAPASDLNVRLDIARLDLGAALRGAGIEPPADGKISSHLRLSGNAGNPVVDLTLDGHHLELRRPPTKHVASAGSAPTAATKPADPINLGNARVRLAYQDRAAHADLDFSSAHGGSLKVDAAARIDLSYPHVKAPIDVKKLAVRGKVLARDFDVAWIAGLAERVESLGGHVDVDAKLAGTVGDPQLVGDVRWKNGQLVTTAAPPATSPRAARAAAQPPASGVGTAKARRPPSDHSSARP